jgi:hypothetical protein
LRNTDCARWHGKTHGLDYCALLVTEDGDAGRKKKAVVLAPLGYVPPRELIGRPSGTLAHQPGLSTLLLVDGPDEDSNEDSAKATLDHLNVLNENNGF